MAYKNNIPNATDATNVSQVEIKENFAQIETVFSENHSNFGTANEGKHSKVVLPEVADPVTGANEIALFCKNETLTTKSELFIRNESAGDIFPISAAGKAADGWAFLSSGLLIKWGQMVIPNNTGRHSHTWTAGATFPAFVTQLFSIVQVGVDAGTPAKDSNAVAYVLSVANPLQVDFRIWRRNLRNLAGSDKFPFSVWILALGTTASR